MKAELAGKEEPEAGGLPEIVHVRNAKDFSIKMTFSSN